MKIKDTWEELMEVYPLHLFQTHTMDEVLISNLKSNVIQNWRDQLRVDLYIKLSKEGIENFGLFFICTPRLSPVQRGDETVYICEFYNRISYFDVEKEKIIYDVEFWIDETGRFVESDAKGKYTKSSDIMKEYLNTL